MGHERLGILPRTKKWKSIIEGISFALGEDPQFAKKLASQTLANVREQYEGLSQDKGIKAAFAYLVALTGPDKPGFENSSLTDIKIDLSTNPSPLIITYKLSEYVKKQKGNQEYAELASKAAADAIAKWYRENSSQNLLFDTSTNATNVWSGVTGREFCNLSRLFFSNLTERYLKYFLERNASSYTNSIANRNTYSNVINNHIKELSNHAFETSKITQSFAAGWFNKNSKDRKPSDSEISGFLNVAFGKMRQELLREEKGN